MLIGLLDTVAYIAGGALLYIGKTSQISTKTWDISVLGMKFAELKLDQAGATWKISGLNMAILIAFGVIFFLGHAFLYHLFLRPKKSDEVEAGTDDFPLYTM